MVSGFGATRLMQEGPAKARAPARDRLHALRALGASGPPGTSSKEHEELSPQAWQDALDLIRQAAEIVRASEARATEVEAELNRLAAERRDELDAARGRVLAAEARAADAENRRKAAEIRAVAIESRQRAAEARAETAERRMREAEAWLKGLHGAIVGVFPGLEHFRASA
jgi:hypothetical protein